MIIYNVTVKPDISIAEKWKEWMLKEHMPEIIATGCFSNFQLMRLLDIDETDGPTYAAQYLADSKADYDRYIEMHATAMRKKATDQWGDKFIAFRSLMEIVQ